MSTISHPFRVYSLPDAQNGAPDVSSAERAFGQMDMLYRRLVEFLPEAVYCCDTAGRITLFNRAALHLWGRVPELGVERWSGAHRLYTANGDRLAPEHCQMAQTLRERKTLGPTEVIIERPDGSRRVAIVHPQLVCQGNVVLGAVNVIVDITERKNAENRLRDADARKDDFLAMLAHELRNPLAPVRTATELLKRVNIADPTALEAVQVIERQVTQLARLVDDLLDVARLGRDQVSLQMEHVRLGDVLSNAIDVIIPRAHERGQSLRINQPEDEIMLYCDPVRVAQMIGNLLHNASTYTPANGHIGLTAKVCDDHLEVRVSDDGYGIDPAIQERIFELFMRGGSLGVSGEGLGVGLSVVKTMAELHGGSVSVSSAGIGQGSEFMLKLPILAVHPMYEPPAAAPVCNVTGPRRILLVDDNVDSVTAMQVLLELDGHTVRMAHDGFAALEIVREFQPDAFIIDIGLPGMDGYELVRTLRRRADTGGATIVAMSGWGAPEDVRRAHEAGFDQHLSKPADYASVVAALQQTHVFRRPDADAL